MAQVISFINMKGGVGKTTLAVNIAYALADAHHKRVLVVDIDPQFNASTYLVTTETYLDHLNKRHSIYDIFQPPAKSVPSSAHGKTPNPRSSAISLETSRIVIKPGLKGQLHLIPSTLDLMMLETSQRRTEDRLRNFIRKFGDAYDYILIDCPPTISFFTQAAMLAADSYIVPVKPDPLSIIGLPLLERWLETYTENAGISVDSIGIVFTMVRPTNQMVDIMSDLRAKRGDAVFRDHLPTTTKVAESVQAHLPIHKHAPGHKVTRLMFSIADEFVERTS